MQTKSILSAALICMVICILTACGDSATGNAGNRQYYVYDGNSKKVGKLISYTANYMGADADIINVVSGNAMLSFKVDDGRFSGAAWGWGPWCYYVSSDCSGPCLVLSGMGPATQFTPKLAVLGLDWTMHIHDGSTATATAINSAWSSINGCETFSATLNVASTVPYAHPLGLAPPLLTPPFMLVEE